MAPSESAGAGYFVLSRGKVSGPFRSRDLRAMITRGELRRDDRLSRFASGPWKEAGSVAGLFPESGAAAQDLMDFPAWDPPPADVQPPPIMMQAPPIPAPAPQQAAAPVQVATQPAGRAPTVLILVAALLIAMAILLSPVVAFLLPVRADPGVWFDFGTGRVNLSRVTTFTAEVNFKLVGEGSTLERLSADRDLPTGITRQEILQESRGRWSLQVADGPLNQSTLDRMERLVRWSNGASSSCTYQAYLVFDGQKVKLPGFEDSGISYNSDRACLELVRSWLRVVEQVQRMTDR